ncbi:MAG: DNA-directed RNA polymerase I core subunit rpa12 [Trichoglossum hirsutum]|nr:MAG: DNA-directed RNA polymerase I core subunit rpa12 [Trichoglossum hirsutum]
MAAIGSLLFCTACGNLLDNSSTGERATVACDVCGTGNKDTSSKTIVAKSKPDAFPSALQRKKHSNIQTLEAEDVQTEALIRQTCSECGCEEMRYYVLQLRSADEGSTVFFTCPRCNHK